MAGGRGDHRAALSAVLLTCLAVVAFLPSGFSRWTLPKLTVMVIAAGVALFAPRTGKLPRWAWAVIVAGLGALMLSALVNGDPAALWGRWPRYNGPLTAIPVAAAAVWTGAALLGPAADNRVRRAFRTGLSVAAILIAVVALAETLGARPLPSDLDRPGSLLGNASDQGIVALMIAAVLFAWLLSEVAAPSWERWLVRAGLVAAIGTTGLAASRAGYLGLAFALAAVVGLTALARRRQGVAPALTRAAWWWTGGLAAGAVAVVAANPESLRRLFVRSGLVEGRPGDRWTMWADTLELIGSAPLLGHGSGGFIDAIGQFQDAAWFAVNGRTVLESPHNWVLELLTDGGVVLLGVVVAGLVLAVKAAAPAVLRVDESGASGRGAVAALSGALLALLTYFTNAPVLVLGGLLLGSLIAEPLPQTSAGRPLRKGHAKAPKGPSSPPQRRSSVAERWSSLSRPVPSGRPTALDWATRAAVGVWAILLLIATGAELPFARAVGASAAGEVAAAKTAFASAQTGRPWDGDIASIAAQSFAQASQGGDPAAAAAAVLWGERAVARLPRSAPALEAWAVGLEASGDFAAAAVARERLVGVLPADPEARLNFAITLALAGSTPEAVEQAKLAQKLDPESEAAAELLVRLCMDPTIPACAR